MKGKSTASPPTPSEVASSPAAAHDHLLLRAARGKKTERTPVWLMRQAGRFDPAYAALRRRCDLTLEEMFRRPDLAAEITLLPIRFGVDAAIIFQDILTPLAPMGANFVYRPGPHLEDPIRRPEDFRRLKSFDPCAELPFVPESIKLVKEALGGKLPLIGFAGAPLTLAAFLISGGSPTGSADTAKAIMREDPRAMHGLLERLADLTADYLRMQIEAGADAIQLFESVADLFSEQEYEQFAHPYHLHVFEKLGATCPTILFVKEQPFVDLMARSGASVLSVGGCVDLVDARRRLGDRVALQGNVDNEILRSGSLEQVEEAVAKCIRAGGHRGHILNLNHGVLKDTPVEHVQRLIETCKTTLVSEASEEPVRPGVP